MPPALSLLVDLTSFIPARFFFFSSPNIPDTEANLYETACN